MSDVANLFAKKKKKKKGDKKDKKDKKSKSKKSTTSETNTDVATSSSSTTSGWTSSTTQYKSILGTKAPKFKKKLAVEQTEEEVKFEGMTESEYNNHVQQDGTKKDFHKARMLADAKAKMSENKVEVVEAAPKTLSWREREERRQASSAKNIRGQLGNAAHFPSLGGNAAAPTNSWTTQSNEVSPAASKAPAGAWGAMAEDEDIKKEVAAVLHDQDPEVIRLRELEQERLRKIELEFKNTWKPSKEEGGINEKIEDSFIEKKVKSMMNEFLAVGDTDEVILCIKEFRNPSKHGFVLQRIFEEAFETLLNDSNRKEVLTNISNLIAALRKQKKKSPEGDFKGTGFLLTKEQIVETVEFLGECMEDIKVDIPQAPDRFAEMCKQLQIKQVLPGLEKSFIPAATFDGAKDNYDFKMGASGMGYYLQRDGASESSAAAGGAGGGAGGAFAAAAPSAAPSKPNPFGDAKPVSKKADPFGGAKPVAAAKPNPFGDAKPVSKRSDPFGGAKPVAAAKPNPFGDAKPVSKRSDPFGGAKPVSKKTDPFGGAKPVAAAKPNPFGDAKPVSKKSDPFAGAKPVAASKESSEDLTAMFGTKKKKKKKKKAYVA